MHPDIRRPATQYLHAQTTEGVYATGCTNPRVSCQLTDASASLLIKWKAKCPGLRGGWRGWAIVGGRGGRRGEEEGRGVRCLVTGLDEVYVCMYV